MKKYIFLFLLTIYSCHAIAAIYPLKNSALSATIPTAKKCIVVAAPSYWPKTWPDVIDCRGVTWSEAFDEMHAKISREYAYSKWRGINWENLYNKFKPIVALAEKKQDKSMYYQAVREYLIAIHDGHVWINPDLNDLDETRFVSDEINKHIGGSYGLIISKTDHNKLIVSYVLPKSDASNANIKIGDEIIKWNGIPIKQAISDMSITWSDEFEDWGFYDLNNQHSYSSYSPATLVGFEYEKIRLLVRGSIGQNAYITFISSIDHKIKHSRLTAINDQKKILNLTRLYPVLDPKNPIEASEYKILSSGYGYLKIIDEDPFPAGNSKVYATAKKAIELFIKNKVPGVILDLRGNMGGTDQLAADLSGFFTDKLNFYESITTYDKNSGTYQPYVTVSITPQPFHYDGPVMILTNVGTISSGEGIPMLAKKLQNLHILSFDSNTLGSFGMPWFHMIELPGNFQVSYPIGRSLDESNNIQVDANENLIGGVQTDIKIPMTTKTAIDIFTNGKDIGLSSAENCLHDQCWLYNLKI